MTNCDVSGRVEASGKYIWMSDHGYSGGSRGRWRGRLAYDGSFWKMNPIWKRSKSK